MPVPIFVIVLSTFVVFKLGTAFNLKLIDSVWVLTFQVDAKSYAYGFKVRGASVLFCAHAITLAQRVKRNKEIFFILWYYFIRFLCAFLYALLCAH